MLFWNRDIKAWRNHHLGERCFIVGTGPSLNSTNLSLLKGQVVFGVNTCYNLPQVDFSYFCVMDTTVTINHGDAIKSFVDEKNIPLFARFFFAKFRTREYFPTAIMVDERLYWDGPKASFMKGVSFGFTVIIMAIRIAHYMGLQRVCLLGCDCHYSDDETQHHFDGSPVGNSVRKDWEPVFHNYELCNEYFASTHRQLVNCTAGGRLEVLPRVSLEEEIVNQSYRSIEG